MKKLKLLLISGLFIFSGFINAQTGIIINSGAKLGINNAFIKINDGDFINNSSENNFNGTVTFSGTSAQTIGGSVNSRFSELDIDNANTVNLENDIYLTDALFLSNGILNVNNYNLTLSPVSLIGGSFSVNNMINLDGTGKIIKEISSNDNILFPVGDLTSGADYSPVELMFNSGTYTGASYSIDVENNKHANNTSNTNYLNRYWTIESTGITNFSCDAVFHYTNADISGTESGIYGGLWNGSAWTILGQASSLQFSGTLSEFGEITGAEQSMLVSIKDLNDENIQVNFNNGIIQILTPDNIRLSHVEIYNTIGQLIMQKDLKPSHLNEFSFNKSTGNYFLRIFSKNASFVKKIIL